LPNINKAITTKDKPLNVQTEKQEEELTNPALNYEYGQSIMDNKEVNLEDFLGKYIQQREYHNQTTHVSVYYRNLNNGNRFGINEKEMFSPASLMKLPLLLVYLKKIEKDPSLRDKQLTYIKGPDAEEYLQNIKPEEMLIDQQIYTIRELLTHMIVYSDNRASTLLERNITLKDYEKAFTENNMLFPKLIDGRFDNNVSVRDYARFFRVLFNASYVNKDLSNYALLLLTQVNFKKGLVTGIDKNIMIAHKFGERGILSANGVEQKQLHDCGIVYYPDHPYILCLMTR
jgi:beta-lactamase class A